MKKSVVITGSTRGIGYSLAVAFLERDCAVTLSGRGRETVEMVAAKLGEKFGRERVGERACDVTEYDQVQGLWEFARERFGRVDIWINNAGTAAPMEAFWQLPADKYAEVVHTNILGTMYGTKVALAGMLKQGFGALYNMEGFGARGGGMGGMTLYGSSKACIHYLNRSLAKETKGGRVLMGAIAPGMVITELVTRQFEGREDELEKSKRILNIIAERAETVAPTLVEKMLKNQKNGATISFSSPARMMAKFLRAPFSKRDLFA